MRRLNPANTKSRAVPRIAIIRALEQIERDTIEDAIGFDPKGRGALNIGI